MDSLATSRLLAGTRAQLQALAQSLAEDLNRITDESVGALLSSTTKILIALDEAYATAEARLTRTDQDDQKEARPE